MKTALTLALLFAGICPAQSFYGAYVSAFPQSSPKPTGGAFWATQISSSYDTWSFSKIGFSLAQDGKHLVSSTRSGIVVGTKNIGLCRIYALVTAGMATNGQATAGAFSEGGFAQCPVNKRGWMLIPGFEAVQSAVTGPQKIIELGFGRTTK